uniref:site-specific DNA-methyltransferase (adenine-specific) n=2 Tax=Levilinea saccharolytica TaxID=229921 RepID=A0A0M9U3A6_9CHLR|nr:adenine-specific DNA methylase [Levilinea saccharolytica]
MKYMGSKRTMLNNGLGHLLLREVECAERMVDLFTGSGSVAWFVAENTQKPVLAVDLQKYSAVLAKSIICRTKPMNFSMLEERWIKPVEIRRNESDLWIRGKKLRIGPKGIKAYVDRARDLCSLLSNIGPIWNAYGGHYFSPTQAITFDLLLDSLPHDDQERTICLAACISAASQCVASPGHTAQPFQPTKGAGKYILESWSRDPIEYVKKALESLCPKHANVEGQVITGNAEDALVYVQPTDLVFIDPPYSSVQYSRFYHVLETFAEVRKTRSVEGVGRYPPINERPQSEFSNITQAKAALSRLFSALASKKCTIILTYPSGQSSNGLSGDYVKQVAHPLFNIECHNNIEGMFSTLGGNNYNRTARQKSDELILLLKPIN